MGETQNLYICQCVCLCLSVCDRVSVPFYVCVRLFAYRAVSVWLSVCVSISLSACLYVSLFRLYGCISFCLFVYLCVCLCLFINRLDFSINVINMYSFYICTMVFWKFVDMAHIDAYTDNTSMHFFFGYYFQPTHILILIHKLKKTYDLRNSDTTSFLWLIGCYNIYKSIVYFDPYTSMDKPSESLHLQEHCIWGCLM